MIRDLLDNLPADPLRLQTPFSSDMQKCHKELFRPSASRSEMEAALNDWLADNQPCLFGRMEAKQGRLSYSLLTENDLYRGDDHVRERIQEDRAAWKSRALEGESHGFIIVAISPQIAMAKVGPEFLQLARHLCGLYLALDDVDQKFYDRIRLVVRSHHGDETRRWEVGVNFFSAQGDGRWWRDHRFPGGIAYSMNSVGHMARHKAEQKLKEDDALAAKIGDVPRNRLVGWALPTAMRSIGKPQIRNPQGTWLVKRGAFSEDTNPPTEEVRAAVMGGLLEYSENRYHGRYHTDETIPSPYFDLSITSLEQATLRDDLFFTYLHSLADEDYPAMGVGMLRQAIEEDENSGHAGKGNI